MEGDSLLAKPKSTLKPLGANFEGTLPPTLRSRVKKPQSFQLKNGDKERRSLEMRRPRGPMHKRVMHKPSHLVPRSTGKGDKSLTTPAPSIAGSGRTDPGDKTVIRSSTSCLEEMQTAPPAPHPAGRTNERTHNWTRASPSTTGGRLPAGSAGSASIRRNRRPSMSRVER